ncbi:hypothetical protein TRVL_09276 [Trypanosoma vivax]|nr:hypothetical protein TRVL_09276 [Trypanosoma vivax]
MEVQSSTTENGISHASGYGWNPLSGKMGRRPARPTRNAVSCGYCLGREMRCALVFWPLHYGTARPAVMSANAPSSPSTAKDVDCAFLPPRLDGNRSSIKGDWLGGER